MLAAMVRVCVLKAWSPIRRYSDGGGRTFKRASKRKVIPSRGHLLGRDEGQLHKELGLMGLNWLP